MHEWTKSHEDTFARRPIWTEGQFCTKDNFSTGVKIKQKIRIKKIKQKKKQKKSKNILLTKETVRGNSDSRKKRKIAIKALYKIKIKKLIKTEKTIKKTFTTECKS